MRLFHRFYIKLMSVMLIVVFAFPFAETSDCVQADGINSQAVDFICGIGLMYGAGSEDFIDDIQLSYSEFTQIFENLGWIVTKKDNGNPTADDVAKEMLSLFGYKVIIEATYSLSYFDQAMKMGLFRGLSVNLESPVTRYQMALILYNALDVQIYRLALVGTVNQYVSYKDQTFMTEILKLKKVKGLVTDDGVASFDGDSRVGINQTVVNGEVYECSDNIRNAQRVLGRIVEGYYSTKVDDFGTIVYLTVSEGEDSIVILASRLLSYKSGLFTYEDSNGHIKKVSISPKTAVFYNGQLINSYSSSLFDFDEGTITIVRSGGSNEDTVIVRSYETYVAGNKDDEKKIISNKAGSAANGNLMLDLGKTTRSINIFSDTWQRLSFSDIQEFDVLSVSKNPVAIEVIVSRRVAVNSMITDTSYEDGERKITTNYGKTYGFSSAFVGADRSEELLAGSVVDLYLTVFQRIAWCKYASDELQVGCLVWVDKSDGLFDKLYVAIYKDNDSKQIFESTPKIRIRKEDGNSIMVKAKNAYDFLCNKNEVVRYTINAEGKLSYIELPISEDVETADHNFRKIFDGMASNTYASGTRSFGNSAYIKDKDTIIFAVSKYKGIDDLDSYKVISRSEINTAITFEIKAYVKNALLTADYIIIYDVNGSTNLPRARSLFGVVQKISHSVSESGDFVYKLTYNQNGIPQEIFTDTDVAENAYDMYTATTAVPNRYAVKAGDIIRFKERTGTNYAESIQILYRPDIENTLSPGGTPGSFLGMMATHIADQYSNPLAVDGTNTIVAAPHLSYKTGTKRCLFGWVLEKDGNVIKVTTQDVGNASYIGEVYRKSQGDYLVESLYVPISGILTAAYNSSFSKCDVKKGDLDDIKTYKDSGALCSRVIITYHSGSVSQCIVLN